MSDLEGVKSEQVQEQPASASPSQENVQNLGNEQAREKPAEALNTESSKAEAKHVPYERFKEVNDKYKSMEQQMKAFEEKAKIADAFERACVEYPEFNKALEESLAKINRDPRKLESEIVKLSQKVELIESERNQFAEQQKVTQAENRISSDWDKISSSISKENLPFYEELVAKELVAQFGKEGVLNITSDELKFAFNKVHEAVQKIVKAESSKIVSSRTSVPPSTRGSAPKDAPNEAGDFDSRWATKGRDFLKRMSAS